MTYLDFIKINIITIFILMKSRQVKSTVKRLIHVIQEDNNNIQQYMAQRK
jgi:hypothetical protein